MQTKQTIIFIRIFRISCLLLLAGFSSCKTSTLCGTYLSQDKGVVVRQIEYRLFNKSRTSGTKLELLEDSTFQLETCANLAHGSWTKINDSLWLFPVSMNWKIDSLNRINPILHYEKFSYLVQGEKLVSIFTKLEEAGKTITVYEILEKSEAE